MPLETDTPTPPGRGPADPISGPPPAREFLAFRLGAREYAVALQAVRDILPFERPMPIAGLPYGVGGVILRRGSAVPIVDLLRHMGHGPSRCGPGSVVIVLGVGHRNVGIVADAVCDLVVGSERPRPSAEHRPVRPGDPVLAVGTLHQNPLILADLGALARDLEASGFDCRQH